MMGNFYDFLSSAKKFSKSTFSKNSFRNTIRVSNSLDPDQARRSVGPDLVPNCMQKLSADDTRMQRVMGVNIYKGVSTLLGSGKRIK